MFYGSGAGKLPTASAVVGDIVEEAKNPGRNLGVMWSEEKLELEGKEELKRRFFVRTKGSPEVVKGKLAADFGEIEFVNIEGMQGEFGFVTALMPEGEYEKKAVAYQSEIISMIRVEK